ncbi:type II toxin-antitoxin system CcdA family antitoxin [Serratia marcescens]|uniref:type II toxin-antitoxin system CcdA family antitoxin n=1 Tax=Serratia TaxID=613 RepID=UPI00066D77A2|nr:MULTISPECIES: type II toxin-antitoxin system CcdA family antitoxin [Serratia]MBH3098399.1 type II toxin-antitoxin system CcdA family antitoxin [Serratia marcescens]MBH3217612.1 type II toxin-antitoxin system CcdA family antitoxin [Serratia marcescens]MDP8797971.1 type II toxin-antitoxin system CcdA family antitoxin [Serratia marcescens]MDX7541361.1 type II toxin-antitoxin system CcdA family antitoxin [Serratia marcescens]NGH08134.1 type II toxin-antitoxin system CcdA family antitoxin [Serra
MDMANNNVTKKTVNVTIDRDLFQRAKSLGVNVSSVLTDALSVRVRDIEIQQWREQNREALEELNRITEENGLLSDEYRTF